VEALAEFRALDCKRFAALTLDVLGMLRLNSGGDLALARAELEEAVVLAAETGFERGMLFLDTNLAEIEFALGNHSAAIALAERAVSRHYATRESLSLAIAWSNLAMYYAYQERWPDAQSAAESSLGYAHEADARSYRDFALQTFAALKAHRGDWHAAAQLLGYVDARLVQLGLERGTTEQAGYDRLIATLRDNFGAALGELLASGATLSDTAAELIAKPLALAG